MSCWRTRAYSNTSRGTFDTIGGSTRARPVTAAAIPPATIPRNARRPISRVRPSPIRKPPTAARDGVPAPPFCRTWQIRYLPHYLEKIYRPAVFLNLGSGFRIFLKSKKLKFGPLGTGAVIAARCQPPIRGLLDCRRCVLRLGILGVWRELPKVAKPLMGLRRPFEGACKGHRTCFEDRGEGERAPSAGGRGRLLGAPEARRQGLRNNAVNFPCSLQCGSIAVSGNALKHRRCVQRE